MIPYFVYGLCTVTSAICAFALFLQFRRGRARMLLWCGVGFAGFTLSNLLLLLDFALGTHIDLSILRTIPAVIGLTVMLFAFIWEAV